MSEIIYHPIGVVHTPFKDKDNIPVQPLLDREDIGTVELFPEYTEGLSDLEGFSHIILLCHFHLSKDYNLKVIPRTDNQERGLFSTRSPSRPNPIGLSTVQLIKIEGNKLTVKGVDIMDGTPILDIKPFSTKIDWVEEPKIGWMEKDS